MERSHGRPRGISNGYRGRTDDSDGKWDNTGLRYDELDDIRDTKALSNYQKRWFRSRISSRKQHLTPEQL